MDYNSLTPEQKEMIANMTPKDLAMVRALNTTAEDLAASGAGADYPVTDNYQLKYFNGDNFASFGVLTQDIIAIDAQMKKNEDGLKANTEEVTEINQNVQQLLTDVPKVSEKAEQANQTASSAASDAHLAVQSANNAIQAASSASSQVTTLAGEVGEVQTAQETMQQDIQTNSNDISGLSTTIGTLNTSVTEVSNKLNTTVANVQKLSAGFNNVLQTKNTSKTANVILSYDATLGIYKIRVSATSVANDVPFLIRLNSTEGPSIAKSKSIALSPINEEHYGIGVLEILKNNNKFYFSGLCYNNTEFVANANEVSESINSLLDVVFATSPIILLGLPDVPITTPTAASSTHTDNHNNPDIPYDGTSQGGIGKQEPVITP